MHCVIFIFIFYFATIRTLFTTQNIDMIKICLQIIIQFYYENNCNMFLSPEKKIKNSLHKINILVYYSK